VAELHASRSRNVLCGATARSDILNGRQSANRDRGSSSPCMGPNGRRAKSTLPQDDLGMTTFKAGERSAWEGQTAIRLAQKPREILSQGIGIVPARDVAISRS